MALTDTEGRAEIQHVLHQRFKIQKVRGKGTCHLLHYRYNLALEYAKGKLLNLVVTFITDCTRTWHMQMICFDYKEISFPM